ncbi:MAG: nucleoside diphosphate kinase regulator [Deltaproteobacteria bacterium]|nr:nucleoside diphosphate kinase regulator [Deltaproteobacteria bacterium]
MQSVGNHDVISWFDKMRLEGLMKLLRERPDEVEGLDALAEKLERARIVGPEEVSPGVVTMNSEVMLSDLDSGEKLTVKVVFPAAADPAARHVSVLAPIGLALLGCAEGAEVEWPAPGGKRRLRLTEVSFQPEAAGIYNL